MQLLDQLNESKAKDEDLEEDGHQVNDQWRKHPVISEEEHEEERAKEMLHDSSGASSSKESVHIQEEVTKVEIGDEGNIRE